MTIALTAAQYWIDVLGFALNRKLVVAESADEFFPTAYLYFNPKYCINMKRTRLKFFGKQQEGNYLPVDPPEVMFEVFELPEKNNLTSGEAAVRSP